MRKHEQLYWIRSLKLATPPFSVVEYEQFEAGNWEPSRLTYPLAVRSSYTAEDGAERSNAGKFKTLLHVQREDLAESVAAVFRSYPRPEDGAIILQEMVPADWSGVLFAYHSGVWKVEMAPGLGEAVVGGRVNPEVRFLPRLRQSDRWWNRLAGIWEQGYWPQGVGTSAMVELSLAAERLLRATDQPTGLDIEFAIAGGRLYLLQARTITSAADREEILTTANHREILPPYPSRLMTDIICRSGKQLYSYYQHLDPSLPVRSFIRKAEGMPWINLSALLDTLAAWGLPTALVCRSVGAVDPYRLKLRLPRVIQKVPVFFRMLWQQRTLRRRVDQFLETNRGHLRWRREERQLFWAEEPEDAWLAWVYDFTNLYVKLVTYMQEITGAVSGPLAVLKKLGLLEQAASRHYATSKSTDFLKAFEQFRRGILTQKDFLAEFGHRGFYESDIGSRRFCEFTSAEWQQLLGDRQEAALKDARLGAGSTVWSRLMGPVFRLVHVRERLRHEVMYFFQDFRQELIDVMTERYGADFDWCAYSVEEMQKVLATYPKGRWAGHPPNFEQSGWDLDTFLLNEQGRRVDLASLFDEGMEMRAGIGIYPGVVQGQVWRVQEATLQNLQSPPYSVTILVADALDPGWAPFFARVDGVVSYTGGLLSHASILLRETGLPSITQLPRKIELKEGDWIEMNGKTGEIQKLGTPRLSTLATAEND